MANWWDDITSFVNRNVPGAGEINKVGAGIESLPSEFWSALKQYPAQIGKGIEGLIPGGGGGGGGGSSSTDTTIPPPAGGTSTSGTASPSDNALMMGLGMFFQNYLAPMIAKQNTANQNLTSQWGNLAQQALQQPLPAGVKATGEANLAQDQFLQGLANQAGNQQALGAIPFQQFIQGTGAETAGLSALTDALSKVAGSVALYGGNVGGLSQAIQTAMGGPNTFGGQISGILSGVNSGAGLTPGIGLPGTTTTGTTTTGTGATPTPSPAAITGPTGTTASSATPQQQAAAYQSAVKNDTLTAAQATSLLEQLGYTQQQAQQILGTTT